MLHNRKPMKRTHTEALPADGKSVLKCLISSILPFCKLTVPGRTPRGPLRMGVNTIVAYLSHVPFQYKWSIHERVMVSYSCKPSSEHHNNRNPKFSREEHLKQSSNSCFADKLVMGFANENLAQEGSQSSFLLPDNSRGL